MAFLSQALAFETTSELSAFAEREFCPAAGMEPGQLRELLPALLAGVPPVPIEVVPLPMR